METIKWLCLGCLGSYLVILVATAIVFYFAARGAIPDPDWPSK